MASNIVVVFSLQLVENDLSELDLSKAGVFKDKLKVLSCDIDVVHDVEGLPSLVLELEFEGAQAFATSNNFNYFGVT